MHRIHEGLHDPVADPEALLPVPGEPGQGFAQNGGGEILDRDLEKDHAAAPSGVHPKKAFRGASFKAGAEKEIEDISCCPSMVVEAIRLSIP